MIIDAAYLPGHRKSAGERNGRIMRL